MLPARPCPVVRPIRRSPAGRSPSSDRRSGISQQNAKPNRAPACEYVAIAVGSSFAAPLIRPGPSTFSSRGLLGPTTGLREVVRSRASIHIGRSADDTADQRARPQKVAVGVADGSAPRLHTCQWMIVVTATNVKILDKCS